MLKKFFAGLCLTAVSVAAYAVPACPEIERVMLPDGSSLSLRLVGDEFFNYTSTVDGYPVERSADGWYYYLDEAGRSGVRARDPECRDQQEKTWLAALPETGRMRSRKITGPRLESHRTISAGDRFRGLVILVEYNDCPFSRTDIRDIFDGMFNIRGYDGFVSATTGTKEEYSGSVADYFHDSSGGLFQPQFDVVGPVKVDYSRLYPNQTANAKEVFAAALSTLDPTIDFSRYDCDGDGKIDLLYFIVSGPGSNYSGNDSRLMWPHASVFTGITLDGVEASAMACSTEFHGRASDRNIDGIGVMCHEFSHVLGLPDLYDTDYAGSGGQSIHPNSWMIMAAGAYFNRSRTPCAYSAFERMYAGFITPDTISSAGTYQLPPIQQSRQAFLINTFSTGEYFLFENRRKTHWDAYLPGEGLLVYHVDMNDSGAWTYNQVNRNPDHNCLRLVRAADQSQGSTIVDSPSDPFPGQSEVTELDNTTDPSLRSWSGNPNPLTLHDIAEGENGDISFRVHDEGIETLLEDFEKFIPSGEDDLYEGAFCKWKFDGAVSLAEGFGQARGHSLSIGRGGHADAICVGEAVTSVTFEMFNNNPVPAVVRVFYRPNEGNWRILRTKDASENITVTASDQPVSVTVAVDAPTGEKGDVRFELLSGRMADGCRIDNVRILADKAGGAAVSSVPVAGIHVVSIHGCLEISGLSSLEAVELYTVSGVLVGSAIPYDGKVTFGPCLMPDIYVARQGNKTIKVSMTD